MQMHEYKSTCCTRYVRAHLGQQVLFFVSQTMDMEESYCGP